MKSLVLKDLFNIGHNAKSMLFILVVFAVALIPFSGVEGYIFVCAILCSMMIVTTFSYDTEHDTTTLRRSVRALFRAAAFAFYPSRHHSRHSSKIFWDFT